MARRLNENNLAGIENSDLYNFEVEFIPLASSDYMLEFIRGARRSWICQFKCKFNCSEEICQFIDRYLSINDETLKINNDKKCGEKSPYSLNRFYRCYHDTRYEKTRVSSLNLQKPNKHYKSTHWPFNLSVKIVKEIPTDEFPCISYIEHAHNHPTKALQSLSFKSIPDLVASSVRQLFDKNMTPSMAYYEYLRQLRTEVSSELEFHMKKADRSFCPWRRDFNSLYKRYCKEEFGGKNRNKMFDQFDGKISEYKEKHPSCKLSYQLYDPERSKPLIIAILTSLMSRIHSEVCFSAFEGLAGLTVLYQFGRKITFKSKLQMQRF